MINQIERTYAAKHETSSVNEIKVSVYYKKGGMNYFTSRPEKRGYYFSITPQTRNGHFVTYTGFSGAKTCVLPVARQSKKSFETAKSKFNDYIDSYLKDFCNQNGYTIIDENNYTERESERRT